MSHTISARRLASTLAASALLALVLAAPASARPNPSTGGPAPAIVAHQPSDALLKFKRHESLDRSGKATTAVPAGSAATTVATGSNGAADYLQLGAGLVAGIALAGAGAAVVSRRSHRTASAV